MSWFKRDLLHEFPSFEAFRASVRTKLHGDEKVARECDLDALAFHHIAAIALYKVEEDLTGIQFRKSVESILEWELPVSGSLDQARQIDLRADFIVREMLLVTHLECDYGGATCGNKYHAEYVNRVDHFRHHDVMKALVERVIGLLSRNDALSKRINERVSSLEREEMRKIFHLYTFNALIAIENLS